MKLVKKCFNSSYQLVFKNLIKCLKEAFRKLFVVEALKPLLRSSSDASHILLYRKKQAEYIDHDMSICNQSRLNQFMTFNKHDAIFWWKISSHSPMLPLIPKNEIFFIKFRTSINFHKCVGTVSGVSLHGEIARWKISPQWGWRWFSVINTNSLCWALFRIRGNEWSSERRGKRKIGFFCHLKWRRLHSSPKFPTKQIEWDCGRSFFFFRVEMPSSSGLPSKCQHCSNRLPIHDIRLSSFHCYNMFMNEHKGTSFVSIMRKLN